ncbi:MAG: type III pantothenate kinase [Chloroflexi bacterium]|nr:type III pantothenate kinase [Chloroflexota bacterium]MCI0729057.1 type III pantothenate kinase [Chloroflexota bacterium]
MLLAIDIGNTNITLGLWSGQEWTRQWRLRTVHDQTVDEYGVYLKALLREAGVDGQAGGRVDGAIMSSVVPPLTATFAAVCRDYLGQEALQVHAGLPTGIEVATENPAEVGADRIVNAAAAYHLYPGASIIVDMGTATTFDVVSAAGELLGVAIAPGLGLAAAALASRAAQLSRVALEAPPQAIGRNTVHSMQSGLIFGYVGLIEGLVGRITAELQERYGPIKVTVIGTGGLISLISQHTTVIEQVDPWLTLTGLRLIYELNRGGEGVRGAREQGRGGEGVRG